MARDRIHVSVCVSPSPYTYASTPRDPVGLYSQSLHVQRTITAHLARVEAWCDDHPPPAATAPELAGCSPEWRAVLRAGAAFDGWPVVTGVDAEANDAAWWFRPPCNPYANPHAGCAATCDPGAAGEIAPAPLGPVAICRRVRFFNRTTPPPLRDGDLTIGHDGRRMLLFVGCAETHRFLGRSPNPVLPPGVATPDAWARYATRVRGRYWPARGARPWVDVETVAIELCGYAPPPSVGRAYAAWRAPLREAERRLARLLDDADRTPAFVDTVLTEWLQEHCGLQSARVP